MYVDYFFPEMILTSGKVTMELGQSGISAQ